MIRAAAVGGAVVAGVPFCNIEAAGGTVIFIVPATSCVGRLVSADPVQLVVGTMKITVPPAALMSQNGTPATHVPNPAAALITMNKPPGPTSWEDRRNTERWSASDSAGVCYIN